LLSIASFSWAQTIDVHLACLARGKYLPQLPGGDSLLKHKAIKIGFNFTTKQPDWVAYVLTKGSVKKTFKRNNQFKPDPLIDSKFSATQDDYAGGVFDRGHIAPAEDMKADSVSMIESFYYSNMTAQYAGFNRGIWKKLESQVRTWSHDLTKGDSLLVVAGPWKNAGYKNGVEGSKLPVPNAFFKVIYRFRNDSCFHAIAYLFANEPSNKALQSFEVPLDSLKNHFEGRFTPTFSYFSANTTQLGDPAEWPISSKKATKKDEEED
jgi:endonuclease G